MVASEAVKPSDPSYLTPSQKPHDHAALRPVEDAKASLRMADAFECIVCCGDYELDEEHPERFAVRPCVAGVPA